MRTGVAVIAGGAVLAVFMTLAKNRRDEGGAYDFFRRRLGRRAFFSASNSWSPRTSSAPSPSHPTGESVLVLAGIVLIRTFLSFSLQLEMTGAWPWQQRSVADADKSARTLSRLMQACLRPDDATSDRQDGCHRSSAGTSPNRCAHLVSHVVPPPKDCAAMIAACTTLDSTANQIRLRFALGFRAALIRKTPSVAYKADDHHEVIGLIRRARMPCPARRPDHGKGIEQQHNAPKTASAI